MPHLLGGRGTRDDLVLGASEARALLAGDVVVEEKLDGANVVLWSDGPVVQVSLRSGVDAHDRAGQLGPLRALVAEHSDELRELLDDGRALYAEWLLIAHSVSYDRLPSYLIGLDLWSATGGFLSIEERNARCGAASIPVAPELWSGIPESVAFVESLLGPSSVGDTLAEGLVVRSGDERRRVLAKLLAPTFERIDDAAWRSGRPHNRLAGSGTWR